MKPNRTLLTSLCSLSLLAGCAGAPMPSSYGGSDHGPTSKPGHYPSADSEAADDGGYVAPMQAGPLPAEASGRAAEARPAPSPPMDHDDAFERRRESVRPGLATTWGEQRSSRVTTSPFVRAEADHPFALEKLFYNDPDGIAAMSDTRGGGRATMGRFALGAGHLEIGLRDDRGRFLSGFVAGGESFVTGIAGHRYTIVLKNHSPGRIEAVVSVDGLDVIDGKPASLSKRGYLIDAFGDLEIEGFRTSTEEVAAFRFGSVASSYAEKKHGDSRNVGVIGVALFHERGDSPRFWGTPRSHDDVRRRQEANPFPNTFATPPN
jgi:hypothetical protein